MVKGKKGVKNFGKRLWIDISSDDDPAGRSYHDMSYNIESDVIIMTHGQFSWPDSLPQETWAFSIDSRVWTNMNPSNKPRGVAGHSIAYDSKHDMIILFGGGFSMDQSLSETWAYDYNLNTWENLNPSVSPPPRIGHKMVFDIQSEKIILFGGKQNLLSDSLLYNDVWTYDYESNTWTNVTPAVNPEARMFFNMIYDKKAERSIIYGGYTKLDWNQLPNRQGFKNDTWAYDSKENKWIKLTPSISPQQRAYASSVYHEQLESMILYGGWNEEQNLIYSDTWSYNFRENSWKKFNYNSPGNLSHSSMAYSNKSNKILIFGGYSKPYVSFSNSTWLF